ncbi:hypothetical protein F5Y13DRAFT_187678 [Hypoxylon sp. FL1857]|nr:hypothetical protein F5Y13DRAFT_187678 [Hypoxylon sp. FL1857]
MGQSSSKSNKPPDWKELVDKNKWYFEKALKLKFVAVEGIGYHGGSLIFSQRDSNGKEIRKINVKYARDRQAAQLLANEALCLSDLRGSSHFPQLISLPQTTIRIGASDREYPIIALEYIPYGSLADLRARVSAHGFRIPNNILWHVFRCMVRQILGMRNTLQLPRGQPVQQEQPFRVATSSITHNQPHGRFYKFGGVEAKDDDEHEHLPILKLTDFSRGRREDLSMDGYDEEAKQDAYHINVRAAGRVMEWLACNLTDEDQFSTPQTSKVTLRNKQMESIDEEASREILMTNAHRVFFLDGGLDPALRELVARCLAVRQQDMPPYQQLLELTDDGARARTWEDIPNLPDDRVWDFNEEISKDFVQAYIYDAALSTRSILRASDLAERWRLYDPYGDL